MESLLKTNKMEIFLTNFGIFLQIILLFAIGLGFTLALYKK